MIAGLEPQALYDPRLTAQILGKSYVTRTRRTIKGKVNVISRESEKERVGDASVLQVLKKRAPKGGLLLVIDEVQTLSNLVHGPNFSLVATTLNAIHNGEIGRPVILLAGGLGTSDNAFNALGISRFIDGCIINLGRLSKSAEYAVIRDRLAKNGQAKEDVTPWIQTIAKETHGWPQHIMGYVQPAAATVRKNGGELTESGLSFALRTGREKKDNYYSR